MLLTGHKAEILGCKFNPNGQTLASVGAERQIFLWNTYDECKNYSILPGHNGPILDVHYSNTGDKLYTSSTDKSIMVWDLNIGGRLKKLIGHTDFVNSCNPSQTDSRLVCSGSDDQTIGLYDLRSRKPIHYFKENYQILSTVFDASATNIIYGGIDQTIKIYDLRKNAVSIQLEGLHDSITGLSLNPNGNYVLSNSMDNLLCIWDIRPYAPNRMVLALQGHQFNFEKNLLRCAWSSDGNYVTCGSADRFVYIWNANDGKILYKLSGHLGQVNEVCFHPKEPIGKIKFIFKIDLID